VADLLQVCHFSPDNWLAPSVPGDLCQFGVRGFGTRSNNKIGQGLGDSILPLRDRKHAVRGCDRLRGIRLRGILRLLLCSLQFLPDYVEFGCGPQSSGREQSRDDSRRAVFHRT
jgi:hypothetical protein